MYAIPFSCILDSSALYQSQPPVVPIAFVEHPVTGARATGAQPEAGMTHDGLNAKARWSTGAEVVKPEALLRAGPPPKAPRQSAEATFRRTQKRIQSLSTVQRCECRNTLPLSLHVFLWRALDLPSDKVQFILDNGNRHFNLNYASPTCDLRRCHALSC